MRTTVIPAQVTTVEDTIAGNLTLTQILLLLAPVLISTAIYTVLPEKLAFCLYKIALMALVSSLFIILAVRVKGKLILNWLFILTAYVFRPHLYLYNKNTLFSREEIVQPTTVKEPAKATAAPVDQQVDTPSPIGFDYASLVRDMDVNIRVTKKGLLVVKNI